MQNEYPDNTLWLFLMSDRSIDDPRYTTWGNVYDSKDAAMNVMRQQIADDIEDGTVIVDRLEYQNGDTEVADLDGRMFYRVVPRKVNRTE